MILSNDKKQKTEARLDEKNFVEIPLLDQLERLGWTVLRLQQVQDPAKISLAVHHFPPQSAPSRATLP